MQQRRGKPSTFSAHVGESAHCGHYTANAMDWTTGVWYEFNDKKVTILHSGLTSSFKPYKNKDGNDSNLPNGHWNVGGSQDAYNLLYVKQSYLLDQFCDVKLQNFVESMKPVDQSPAFPNKERLGLKGSYDPQEHPTCIDPISEGHCQQKCL
jgi:hypothetical protein